MAGRWHAYELIGDEFAEKEARTKKVGLWHDKNAMPPWEWRQRRRTSAAP